MFQSWEIISFILIHLAPGSYDVEKSEKIIHQSSGAVTFGIKYKEQKLDDFPGKYIKAHLTLFDS